MTYVYVLYGDKFDELYLGSANNLKERLRQHQDGTVVSTRRYRPWKLVYYEAYTEERLARRREQRLKHHGSAMRALKKRIELLPLNRKGRHGSQSRAGFTLIELLIVTAVFSLTALLAVTVFSNIQTSQRGIEARQRVVSDGRYVLETLARSARTSRINYAYYGLFDNPEPYKMLSLLDDQNTVTCYFKGSPGGRPAIQVLTPAPTNCIPGDPSDWQTITPEDLRVDEFQVYIKPQSDPFRPPPSQSSDCRNNNYEPLSGTCSCYFILGDTTQNCWPDQRCISVANPGEYCTSPTGCICQNAPIQPQVTIYLKTSSTNTAPGESASATLQTTVTSRVYQR